MHVITIIIQAHALINKQYIHAAITTVKQMTSKD